VQRCRGDVTVAQNNSFSFYNYLTANCVLTEMKEEKLYSKGKTAKMLGIHFVTLKKWIYAGKVKAIKTPGGQYRISESEIRRLPRQPAPKKQSYNLREGFPGGSKGGPETPEADASGIRKTTRVRNCRNLGRGERVEG
jgi:excisionase family DNA binding protein